MVTSSDGSDLSLSALAAQAGVPVGTVKYYLREGLLPPGRKRSATRADYGSEHVQRLRLLRVLREVGDVPVERLRDLVAALSGSHDALAALESGAAALAPEITDEGEGAAVDLARQLAAHCGWTLADEAPLHRELASVLEVALAYDDVGPGAVRELAVAYAEVADRLGAADIASMVDADPASMVAQMVVGQVVYGRLLDVLRRIAEQQHAVRRWG